MFIKYFNKYDNRLTLIFIQYIFIIVVKNSNKTSIYFIFIDFLLIFIVKLIIKLIIKINKII